MENNIIYTIGHSTHQVDYFIEILKEYNINCIIDVRSVAASSYNPQYNKEFIKEVLRKNNIFYGHFSDEFGARRFDIDLLDDDGIVDFEKVRRSFDFKRGVEKIWNGIEKGYIISLMCSESEPFDCHRFSMVSVALQKEGIEVRHIMKDKSIKSNAELEELLLKKYSKKIPHPDIFNPNITRNEQLEIAYRLRNKDIGYAPYSKQIYTENYD